VIVRWGLDELEALLRELCVERPYAIASDRWANLPLRTTGRWGEVPTDRIADVVDGAADADGLLAVGGGSAIDLAKSVSAETGLPVVSVPTTYSGSEWTQFFGVRDPDRRMKGGGSGANLAGIVYEPRLTVELPREESGGTALNALAHSAEALYVAGHNPEGDREALAGARLIGENLPRVLEDGHDLDARTGLLEGAQHAGAALGSAGLALGHAMAQAVGGRYGLNLNNALVGTFDRLLIQGAQIGIYFQGQNERHTFRNIQIDGSALHGIYAGATNGGDGKVLDFPELQKTTFDTVRVSGTAGHPGDRRLGRIHRAGLRRHVRRGPQPRLEGHALSRRTADDLHGLTDELLEVLAGQPIAAAAVTLEKVELPWGAGVARDAAVQPHLLRRLCFLRRRLVRLGKSARRELEHQHCRQQTASQITGHMCSPPRIAKIVHSLETCSVAASSSSGCY